MIPLFCFRCSRISTSAEGLRCPQCDRNEYGSVMTANFYSAIPEYENSSPGYHVTAEDASTQVSEEDFMQEEPTREASTQTFEEDFPPLILTREAITQTSDDESDVPLQIDGGHGYENSTKDDSLFQNKTAQDFDWYTGEDQNRLPANSNTNEGEFHNTSYGICYSSTSLESKDQTYATSQQAYPFEQYSVSECENNHYSDELPIRHGINEPAVLINKVNNLYFKGKVADELLLLNNFSDSSDTVKDREEKGVIEPTFFSLHRVNPSINICFPEKFVTAKTMAEQKPKTFNKLQKKASEDAKDGQDKEYIAPSFSSFPRENQAVNKCLQKNLVTEKTVAKQKSESSSEMSRRSCEKCGKYFFKEWTFNAHKKNYCNSNKPYVCKVCGKIFLDVTTILMHERVHNGERPFKCTQCNYATAWGAYLKYHAKMHTNRSPSQSSSKLSIRICRNCKRGFVKEAKFIAHIRSNCNPNPYKCKKCDARFRDMNSLVKHGRVHTQEKSF